MSTELVFLHAARGDCDAIRALAEVGNLELEIKNDVSLLR